MKNNSIKSTYAYKLLTAFLDFERARKNFVDVATKNIQAETNSTLNRKNTTSKLLQTIQIFNYSTDNLIRALSGYKRFILDSEMKIELESFVNLLRSYKSNVLSQLLTKVETESKKNVPMPNYSYKETRKSPISEDLRASVTILKTRLRPKTNEISGEKLNIQYINIHELKEFIKNVLPERQRAKLEHPSNVENVGNLFKNYGGARKTRKRRDI